MDKLDASGKFTWAGVNELSFNLTAMFWQKCLSCALISELVIQGCCVMDITSQDNKEAKIPLWNQI